MSDELILRCDCVAHCSVVAVAHGPFDDEWTYSLDLYESVVRRGVRERLGEAWQVLRGGRPVLHSVVLYAPKARELRDYLVRNVPDDKERGS